MNRQAQKTKLMLNRETLRALETRELEVAVGGTGNTCLHNQCYTARSACPTNCRP